MALPAQRLDLEQVKKGPSLVAGSATGGGLRSWSAGAARQELSSLLSCSEHRLQPL